MEKAIIWSAEEQEKEESIWRRRLFGHWRRGRTEKEKYLGEENIWSAEAMKKKENIYFLIVKNSTLVRCWAVPPERLTTEIAAKVVLRVL